MLTTRTPGRAGGEHRQQRREALERGAVADRGRDGDDQPVGQAGDDARQRAVHPRDDDDGIRGGQVGRDREHPVHARDPDVVHPPAAHSAGRQRGRHLGGDRAVRGAGREHQDRPDGHRQLSHERAAGLLVDEGLGPAFADGGGGRLVHPGGPGQRAAAVERARPGRPRSAPGSCRRRRRPRACRCGAPGRGPAGRSRGRRCAARSPPPGCRIARLAAARAGKGSGMSVVKINAITVPKDKQARFEERFRGRAGAVEKTPGFEWFELLRPLEGTDQYLDLHPLEQRGGLPRLGVRPGLRPRPRRRRRRPRAGRQRLPPPVVLRGARVRRARTPTRRTRSDGGELG